MPLALKNTDISAHADAPTTPPTLVVASPPERTKLDLLRTKIVEQLSAGANALNQIKGPPVLRAQIAVLLMKQLAQEVSDSADIQVLGKIWTEQDRNNFASTIETFHSAFSVSPHVLHGFRETAPEFVFNYCLVQGLCHGRLPVLACDLKDTLASFIEQENKTGQIIASTNSAGFRGVRKAIDAALKVGPIALVTGDTYETVLSQFLLPNGWVKFDDQQLIPRNSSAQNLVWLTRTGMEAVRFNADQGAFTKQELFRGLTPAETEQVVEIIQKVCDELQVSEHFSDPMRCYKHRASHAPRSYDIRGNKDALGNIPSDAKDLSIAFFPAGKLEAVDRARFKSDPSNTSLLELIVCRVNAELKRHGLDHAYAKRGGISTVDVITSDKGLALKHLRDKYFSSGSLLVFLGDKIALTGNDVEGMHEADLSVQVGYEWDPNLPVPDGSTLLRAKRSAPEGGSAEYINLLSLWRKLGLTGLLELKPTTTAISNGTLANNDLLKPQVARRSFTRQLSQVETLVNKLIDLGPHTQHPSATTLASKLINLLGTISEPDPASKQYELQRFELAILKRVVEGGTPVIASDLKDTLAVFDSANLEWFPNAEQSFVNALRNGPFFLITGDSAPNVVEKFLIPSGMIQISDGILETKLPGVHNLHLITRTGLDRLILNFSEGKLERFPLVHGISARDIDCIKDILKRTTELYRCGDIFAKYAIQSDYQAGHVDVRGTEFGDDAVSFAYFPAGVLLTAERPRFRSEMMNDQSFRAMVAYIRNELQKVGLDNVLAQQGGISTIDLTTTTKGTALAQLKHELLSVSDFFVYLGDTVSQNGNDGSTVGVASFTVQVGAEQDPSLSPPPGCLHFHSPVHAREGGASRFIELTIRARKLAATGLWSKEYPK